MEKLGQKSHISGWKTSQISRALFENANIHMVFANQLPERSPIFVRCLCGFADVSLVREKQVLYVFLFELLDNSGFRFLKRFFWLARARTGKNNICLFKRRRLTKHHGPFDDVLQFAHVARPVVEGQLLKRCR